MQAIQRFNLSVSIATVVVMFVAIQYVVPILQTPMTPNSLTYIPLISPSAAVEGVKLLVSGLATVGVYKLFAKLLLRTADRIQFVKSFVYGPAYVEGTWIGRFYDQRNPKWTVEHFEQNLDGLVIKGWAHNSDGTTYADWTSIAASVDDHRGRLTYTYECTVYGKAATQQGIGVFQFIRSASWKAPTGLKGYSSDLIDGARSENNELKISNSLLSPDSAIARARDHFGEK